MTNKVSFLVILFLSILFVTSCTDKKPQEGGDNVENPVVFEFSNEDSINISNLVDEYVASFNSGNFETCADFLFKVRNDSVFPLSIEERNDFIKSMQNIPSFGCERRDLALKTDRDNKAFIAIFLAEADSLNPQAERPTAKFVLNPVKVEGKWYLTVYDPHAEGVGIY